MPLKNTTITLQISGGETKLLGANDAPAVFPENNPLLRSQVTLINGTNSANAQKVALIGYALTGGAHVDLNLSAIAGPFGTVNFTKIRYAAIDNQSTRAGDKIRHGDQGSVVPNPWQGPYGGPGLAGLAEPNDVTAFPARINGWVVAAGNNTWRLENLNGGTSTASGNVLLIGEGT